MAQLLTVKQVAGQLGVARSTVYTILDDRVFPAAPIPLPAVTLAGRRRSSRMCPIPADATETAYRRGGSGTADAVGAARDAAESGGTAGEARVRLDGALGVLPCTSGSGDGNATAPHAPTAAETGGARSAKCVRH